MGWHVMKWARLLVVAAVFGMAQLTSAGAESSRPVSGVLAATNGVVTARPMGDSTATPRQLQTGSQVFFEDEITTAPGVRAQILLRDGTTFSIGEAARLVLDEFVYDPSSGNGGVGVVIKRGAFRFVSGKIAKGNPNNMRVLAGNTSIAVRGTEVLGNVGGGQDSVILISGQIDLVSIGGECGATAGSQGNDMFSIDADGALAFTAPMSETPPSFCQQSLVRPGFGVVVSTDGPISTPTRVEQSAIDNVIDATRVTAASETEEEEDEAQGDGSENESASNAKSGNGSESDSSESDSSGSDSSGSEEDTNAGDESGAEAEPDSQTDSENGSSSEEQSSSEAQPSSEGNASTDEANADSRTGDAGADGDADADTAQASTTSGEAATADQTNIAIADDGLAGDGSTGDGSTGDGSDQPSSSSSAGTTRGTTTGTTTGATLETDDAGIIQASARGDSDTTPLQSSSTTPATTSATSSAGADGVGDGGASSGDSQTTLSAFDAVVMRAFGMMSEESDQQAGGDRSPSVTVGLDAVSSNQQAEGETESDSGEDAAATPIPGTENSITDQAMADAEGSTADNVEAATRDLSDGGSSTTTTTSTSGSNSTPSNSAPAFAAVAGISVADTVADDSFSAINGTLSASDADSGDTLTFGITGGSADTSLAGFTHSSAARYGTLYLNSGNGDYRFVPNDSDIEGLSTTASNSFTLTVSDGTASDSAVLTATINGVDDRPVWTPLTDITLTDTAAKDTFTNLMETVDVVDPEGSAVTVTLDGSTAGSPVPGATHYIDGNYGQMLFNENTGDTSYMINETLVNALATTATESFDFIANDGNLTTTETVTVTINGVDDRPVIEDSNPNFTVATGGARVATVSDAEGHAISDDSASLGALPAWLSFNSQSAGGTTQYFWEVGMNNVDAWQNGTVNVDLMAKANGLQSSSHTTTIVISCGTDRCSEFAASSDTVTRPVITNMTDLGQILSSGLKIDGIDYELMNQTQMDALFVNGSSDEGQFNVRFTEAETGGGSNPGSWDFNQRVVADYGSKTVLLYQDITMNQIEYFDGATATFNVQESIDFSNGQSLYNNTYSLIDENSYTKWDSADYDVKNANGDEVHLTLGSMIGFIEDTNGNKAAVIFTSINPLSSNPAGYANASRQMMQRKWRVLEPQ